MPGDQGKTKDAKLAAAVVNSSVKGDVGADATGGAVRIGFGR